MSEPVLVKPRVENMRDGVHMETNEQVAQRCLELHKQGKKFRIAGVQQQQRRTIQWMAEQLIKRHEYNLEGEAADKADAEAGISVEERGRMWLL